ncbi:MAG: energy transducer TonB [Pseudomonadota bacterium]|nr:energy transducer TonB [Pseudomonadota bacterium]
MRLELAAAVLILSASAQAQVASPIPLPPIGPWKLDYAPDECRLVRSFGSGDKQIVFRLARGSGLQQFDVILASKDIPKLPSKIPMTLKLEGTDTPAQLFDGVSAQVPGRSERYVRWYDGDSNLLKDFGQNQVITVGAGKSYSATLNLVAARPALAALDKCHEDLLQGWGLDLAKLKEAKSPPIPTGNPANWVTTNDYPSKALLAGVSGTVRFMAIVGTEGRPTQCKIALSSGEPELDTVTCQLVMRRAQFKPAANAKGEPVVGYYINRVRWIIPSD